MRYAQAMVGWVVEEIEHYLTTVYHDARDTWYDTFHHGEREYSTMINKKEVVAAAAAGSAVVFGIAVFALVGYTAVHAFCYACVWAARYV